MSMALSMTKSAIHKRQERARKREAMGLPPLPSSGMRDSVGGGSVSKAELARRMWNVDAQYREQAAATETPRRCCSKCKTPYGICAKKDCACHSF